MPVGLQRRIFCETAEKPTFGGSISTTRGFPSVLHSHINHNAVLKALCEFWAELASGAPFNWFMQLVCCLDSLKPFIVTVSTIWLCVCLESSIYTVIYLMTPYFFPFPNW